MMTHAAAPKPEPGRRILVVDDCATSRRIGEIIARRGGHDVLVASDGEQALALARKQTIDLILLDLQMPGLGGLGTLGELKRSPLTRAIPVVVVTIRGDGESLRAARAAGCDAFLAKPFGASELLGEIERCLVRAALTPGSLAPGL